MSAKRVFKTKSFGRWSKKVISDAALCIAAAEIADGHFEADLGQGVCKKRVAISGQGKSRSVRTLVAKKRDDAVIFLAGREKNQPGDDFTQAETEPAKGLARAFERADGPKLNALLAAGVLLEICHEDK